MVKILLGLIALSTSGFLASSAQVTPIPPAERQTLWRDFAHDMSATEVAAVATTMGLRSIVRKDKKTGISYVEVKDGTVTIGKDSFFPRFTFGKNGLVSLQLDGPGTCGAEQSGTLVKSYMSLVAEKYPKVVASTDGFVGDPSSTSTMYTRYSDGQVDVDVGLETTLNRYCANSMHSSVFLRYLSAADSEQGLQRSRDREKALQQKAIDDL